MTTLVKKENKYLIPQFTAPSKEKGLSISFLYHIEMGFLAVIGSYLTGSGWVEALEESGVTTSGKADSFLRGAHVKRSRYVHQVTACFLYQLLRDAYLELQENDSFSDEKSRVPQFRFWRTALELESLLLTFNLLDHFVKQTPIFM